jgi:hypothetical protein
MRKRFGPCSYSEILKEHEESMKAMTCFMPYEPFPATVIAHFFRDKSCISIQTYCLLTEQFKKVWLRDNLLWNIVMRIVFLLELFGGGLLRPIAAVWTIVIAKTQCTASDNVTRCR